MSKSDEFRSGFVSIIGRPNVGKSTLLNRLVGKKIAITSSKPQTTRNRIVGICNADEWQIAYVDTPGIHQPRARRMNKIINRNAINSTRNVDINALMINADGWRKEDLHVLQTIVAMEIPCVLIINKIDKLQKKDALLPLLAESAEKHNFHAMVPVSAKSGDGVKQLQEEFVKMLPLGSMMYPSEQVTEQTDQFLLSEFLREQLFRQLGDELPYATAVTIEEIEERDAITHINATVWVENASHKPIVIGKDGKRLKQIGTYGRKSMEKHLGRQVYLEIWVKVKSGWSDDSQRLRELGLIEDI